MAKITQLTKNDFVNGYLFTINCDLSQRYFMTIPTTGVSYIVDGHDKQIYAYVVSVTEESFNVTRKFFGKIINHTIKFSDCFKIID